MISGLLIGLIVLRFLALRKYRRLVATASAVRGAAPSQENAQPYLQRNRELEAVERIQQELDARRETFETDGRGVGNEMGSCRELIRYEVQAQEVASEVNGRNRRYIVEVHYVGLP